MRGRAFLLKRPRLILFLVLLLLAISGCSSHTKTTPQTTNMPSSPARGSSSAANTASLSEDWPTYHNDLSRSGFDPQASITGPPERLWVSDLLDGDI